MKASSLDWTIVRTAILNDAPASGDIVAANKGKVGRIGRARVSRVASTMRGGMAMWLLDSGFPGLREPEYSLCASVVVY